MASGTRWWLFEKKDGAAAKKTEVSFVKPRSQKQPADQVICTKWQFKVFVDFELQPNEKVSLTGACDQLGNWMPNDSIKLERIDGE